MIQLNNQKELDIDTLHNHNIDVLFQYILNNKFKIIYTPEAREILTITGPNYSINNEIISGIKINNNNENLCNLYLVIKKRFDPLIGYIISDNINIQDSTVKKYTSIKSINKKPTNIEILSQDMPCKKLGELDIFKSNTKKFISEVLKILDAEETQTLSIFIKNQFINQASKKPISENNIEKKADKPQSLKRVLNKAKTTIYTPEINKLFDLKENCHRNNGELKYTINETIRKEKTTPSSLMKVLNNE